MTAEEVPGKPVRVAIVGTGRVARYHLAAVDKLGLELVGVADPTPAKSAAFVEGRDVPTYADAAELLAERSPELVCVCTPPVTHAALAELALRSGAWAYVEKPICASAAELDRLAAVEAETGGRVAGVVQWRSGQGARVAKRFADDGRLGRPLAAVANTMWFRDDAYFAVPWRGKFETELGGTTISHAIHTLDLLLHLAGPWAEVTAMTATAARDIEVEDVSAAAVRLASGGLAGVTCSCLSPRQESYLRVDYERATLELRHFTFYTNASWSLTGAPGHEGLADEFAAALGEADTPPTQASQLAEVAAALRTGGEPPTPLAGLRPTVTLIESIYRSAREGRPVAAE